MINIQRTGNAIVVDFTDNDKYLNNGTIEVAPNELMVVIDESNMATFKKMSNGDTLFGQLIDQIQIQGENVTKDNIIEKFGAIGFSISGGGAVSSVNGQTGDVVITATSLGAITKVDADAAYASKTELEDKQEVFQVNAPMAFNRDETTQDLHLSIDLTAYAKTTDLASKADSSTVEALSTEVAANRTATTALTSKVNEDSEKITSLDTEMGTKQATLVSGQNIKTINNQSILGEGNIDITGGGTITIDSELSTKSENPVQNKVITNAINGKQDAGDYALKSEIPDISGLATKTELSGKLDTATYNSEKASFETKENAAATYQVKGDYATTAQLNSKQDTLVSGTNIKTINGNSLLGEGDITIQAGGTVDTEMSDTSKNAVQNKVIKKYIDDLVGNILTQLQEINGTN